MQNKNSVQIIGHRGACAYAPENTFSSFELAISMGVHSIETDIRKTKDDVLVLFHDDILDRKSNGTGAIEDHTLNELQQLDFGAWFSHDFKGESIVLFSDFLKRYGNKVHLNLELKTPEIEDLVMIEIDKAGLEYFNFVITAFELESLVRIKKINPDIITAYLVSNFNEDTIKTCLDNKIEHICPHSKLLNEEIVSYAHSKGLFVRAWGVGDIDLMKHVVVNDGDGMTIDFPDKPKEYLRDCPQHPV